MYELMCWCWSDNPQHRPTFTQIKEIISTSTFTQLLDSKKLLQEGHNFTTACIHMFRQPLSRRRHQEDVMSEKPSIASPSPSVLSVLAASADEEDIVTVFYGTGTGQISAIQILPGENTIYEVRIVCTAVDNLLCRKSIS